jgi:uncharacterized protein (TIGR03083 family)
MSLLGFDRHFMEFEAETARLAGLVHDSDPQQPVPTCPDWTLEQLVGHVGRGHRWSADIVRRRLLEPIPLQDVVVPAHADERSEWLIAGAQMLADAVRAAGPEQPVWTWTADRSAGFWLRRMLHDEVIHRFDAEMALGIEGGLAPDLAADGVSDILTTIATLSRPDLGFGSFAGVLGVGESVQLFATDPELGPGGEWLAARGPAGVTWRHGHDQAADVVVRGPSLQLLLLLNRRLSPDAAGVEILGNQELFARWLANSEF